MPENVQIVGELNGCALIDGEEIGIIHHRLERVLCYNCQMSDFQVFQALKSAFISTERHPVSMCYSCYCLIICVKSWLYYDILFNCWPAVNLAIKEFNYRVESDQRKLINS